MAVAYESDGGTVWAAANNNNAVSVTLPATRPTGSVLLFVGFCRLITATVATAPSGYTLLNTLTSGTAAGGRIWLYAKEVVGGESAPSFALTGPVTGTSGDIWGACLYCYSGVDLGGGISAILDGTPTTTDAAGTTTCTYPALTTSRADSFIVRTLVRFRDAADTFTFTATWAEREDASTTNRLGGQHHTQDKQATASGSQATVTVAPSNTTSSRYLAVTLALKTQVPPQTIGTVAAAAVVRGVTLVATGTVNIGIASLPGSPVVRGITVEGVAGTDNVPIGPVAAAAVVRGVTPSAAGAVAVTVGPVAAATVVRGVTPSATGAAPVTVGKVAAATAVRGVTPSAAGAVAVTIGRVGGSSASDDFNRADAALSSPWVQIGSSIAALPTDGTVQIVSNVVVGSHPGVRDACAYYAAAASSDDQFSEVTLGVKGQSGPAVRVSGTDAPNIDMYLVNPEYGQLYRVLNGDYVGIGSTATLNDGDVVRLEAEGTTLRLYVDGVEDANSPYTDANIASGQPGVRLWEEAIDDWSGGDLTGSLVSVNGVTVAGGAGTDSVTVGKVASSSVVRGVTVAAAGTVAVTVGKRAAASTVRGITVAAAGTVAVTVGKRAAAAVVRGVTVSAAGAVSVPVGKRAAASVVRGVTVSAAGAVAVPVGKRAAAAVVRGVTVSAAGAASVPVGKKAASSTVRGVTLSAAGTAAFTVGKRAAASSVRGVTVTAEGGVLSIGKRQPASQVFGVTLAAVGAVSVGVAGLPSTLVVRGVTLSGGAVAVLVGRVANPTQVRGVFVLGVGAVEVLVGRIGPLTTVYGLEIEERAAVEYADSVVVVSTDAAGIVGSSPVSPLTIRTTVGGVTIGSREPAVTIHGSTAAGTTISAD